ncbi:hypothetical protein GN956_G15723 [Arapaima gigas]
MSQRSALRRGVDVLPPSAAPSERDADHAEGHVKKHRRPGSVVAKGKAGIWGQSTRTPRMRVTTRGFRLGRVFTSWRRPAWPQEDDAHRRLTTWPRFTRLCCWR